MTYISYCSKTKQDTSNARDEVTTRVGTRKRKRKRDGYEMLHRTAFQHFSTSTFSFPFPFPFPSVNLICNTGVHGELFTCK